MFADVIRDELPWDLLAARLVRGLGVSRVLEVDGEVDRPGLAQALRAHDVLVDRVSLGDVLDALRATSADALPAGRWDLVTLPAEATRIPGVEFDRLLDEALARADATLVPLPGRHARDLGSADTVADVAAGFADREAFRRVDLDLESIAPGVALFSRGPLAPRELVRRYELALQRLQAADADPAGDAESGTPSPLDRLRAENLALRHQQMTSRDFAIGAEAEITRLQDETAWAREEVAQMRQMIAEMTASTSWRLGRGIIGSAARVRDMTRPSGRP